MIDVVRFAAILAVVIVISTPSCAQSQMFKGFGGGRKDIAPKPVIVEFRDKFAVLVGLTTYEDPKLKPVKSTTANLAILSKALEDNKIGRFSENHVATIFGARATAETVTKALQEGLFKKVLPDDLLFIYLCGRAIYRDDDAFFCTYETDLAEPTKAGISIRSVLTELRHRTQCKNIICFLDISPVLEQKWSAQLWNQVGKESNVSILAAAAPGQPSNQSDFMGSSYFAHYLVGGLAAAGGTCNLDAIIQFITAGVATDTKEQLGHEQHPQFEPAADSQEFLASVPGKLSKTAHALHNISFGHPIDEIAMQRPDLLLGLSKHPGQQNQHKEEQNVDFPSYVTKMKKDIQAKWKPPAGFELRKVVVVFSVLRNGAIVEPAIVQGCGEESIDKSALEALHAASPLDPLPAGSPRSVQMRYVFDGRVTQP